MELPDDTRQTEKKLLTMEESLQEGNTKYQLINQMLAGRKLGRREQTEKAIDLYLKVNCNSDIPKHNFERLNDVINEIVALQEKGTKLNVRILANMK